MIVRFFLRSCHLISRKLEITNLFRNCLENKGTKHTITISLGVENGENKYGRRLNGK